MFVKKEIKLGPPLKFYNGEITLRFDEANWTYYRILDNGDLAPTSGVTGVVGIIDKSAYLMPWAAKMMWLKMLRTMPRYQCPIQSEDRVVAISWSEFDELLQKAKGAHKEHFEDAGDVGTAAHTWIEDTIRNAITFNGGVVAKMNEMAPVDERSVSCGLAALDWMQKHNVRFLSTERKIYSRKYNFAGTCDGTALVDSCDDPKCCPSVFWDELSLIDWKTSNQLSLTYLYQSAAYEQAIEEETGADIKSRWVLRLGKEDGKFDPWHAYEFDEDFAGYLACLELRKIHKAVEKRMSDQKKLKTFRKREEKKEEKARIKFEKRKPDQLSLSKDDL